MLAAAAMAVAAGGVAGCGEQVATGPSGQQATAPAVVTATPAGGGTADHSTTQPPPDDRRPTIGSPVAHLTQSDQGVRVRLRPGQSVMVTLAGAGGFSWHLPTGTGTVLRRTSGSGGYPSKQPARATFTAMHPGTSTLSAVDDIGCLHSHPACLPPQRSWTAVITVY